MKTVLNGLLGFGKLVLKIFVFLVALNIAMIGIQLIAMGILSLL